MDSNLVGHEDGDLGLGRHALRHAAKDHFAQAAVAIGAHHQHVRAGRLGLAEQAFAPALEPLPEMLIEPRLFSASAAAAASMWVKRRTGN